jgi:drug/metabolite transporter (DMT)-like permease
VTTEKLKVIVVMVFAVAAVSLGEAMLSKGMKQSNAVTGGLLAQVRGVAGNGYVVGGTFLMMCFYGLYMLALRRADLSFVLPLTALSYLSGATLAKYYLGETVTPTRWIGALVITIGVIIVGLGESGSSHRP